MRAVEVRGYGPPEVLQVAIEARRTLAKTLLLAR